jgi:peptidoglycan/xylan/chitin deacetylase (PgdA/CDA1 family)
MKTYPLRRARIINYRMRHLQHWVCNLLAPPVVVLLYHRVTTLASDPHSISVTPENFRAQLSYLKKHYQIVRFEEDWTKLVGPAFAVTFDDGYADNAREALPVLEDLGVPATFFVSTSGIGSSDEFWWDEMERLVVGESCSPPSFTLQDSQFGKTWPTATPRQRKEMYRELHRLALKVNHPRRALWLSQLRAWNPRALQHSDTNRIMTRKELQRLAQSHWVTLGAHTVHHSPLSALPEPEQRAEILDSKRHLESYIGRTVEVFSYPFGKKVDYDQTSTRICREAGFSKAASAFPGQAYRWTDPYQIPRHIVYNWDLATFATRLHCLWL